MGRAARIQVVRCFPNAEDFLTVFMELEVDVVLMDINLPGKSGIDRIREAKPVGPSVQFLVVTVFENPAYIIQALCAGATETC